MIDYLGSYNYAFFFDKPLYQYIDPYFRTPLPLPAVCLITMTAPSPPVILQRSTKMP